MSRTEQIKARLTRTIIESIGGNSGNVAASSLSVAEWADCWDELGPQARFGLGMPFVFPDDPSKPPVAIPFSADLIDRVTGRLTDADLDDYLTAVEIVMAYSVANVLNDGMTPAEALAKAEDMLYDSAQESFVFLSLTQADALERGVGV